MGTSTRDISETLTTQANERVKQYSIYDIENRPVSIYTAGAKAGDGTKCTRVDYTYIIGSGLVEKMQEYEDVWSLAYDI